MKWLWGRHPEVRAESAPRPDPQYSALDIARLAVERLEECVKARDSRIYGLQGDLMEARALVAKEPWCPKKGVSGGTHHSDTGTDSSWAALDERVEQEACAFLNHPGFKAVLDILEARLLAIYRQWKATDDNAEAHRLHIAGRVYEDAIATLTGKCSLRERKEASQRLEERQRVERERNSSLASVGRSPFVR